MDQDETDQDETDQDGMNMAHYFTNDEIQDTTPIPVSFEMGEKQFSLTSQPGVFSKDKLDTGTQILLEAVLEQKPADNVLDLGCGIGVIGVVLSAFWNCKVTGVDVSERAAKLAEKNYAKYHVNGSVYVQDGLDHGSLAEQKFACILLNPPIRAGKEVIYRLFAESYAHLEDGGRLYIVIRKQHGAASAQKYLESLGFEVERINRDKGFWVLRADKQEQTSDEQPSSSSENLQ